MIFPPHRYVHSIMGIEVTLTQYESIPVSLLLDSVNVFDPVNKQDRTPM